MVFGTHAPSGLSAGPVSRTDDVDPWLGWVERARRGESTAVRALLQGVAPAVQAVVRRMLGSSHPDHDDLVQESLLGFIRALDAFRGQCAVVHYARRIALWRVLEDQKRKLSLKRAGCAISLRDELIALDEPNVDSRVLAARQRARIRALLHTLRPEQAEVLALRHVLDYTVEEIAETTGVPYNTVRSRLRLAKEAMRSRIEGDPLLCELDVRQA
jgi:RNA polymerase sigma factor (sigma-70 family)